jgi:diguanylate cyclase (GGDEF)-like protein
MDGTNIVWLIVLSFIATAALAASLDFYRRTRQGYTRALQDAERRTKESELLTQIGQAVTSYLDSDLVLQTVHKELSKLFEAETFTVAFMEGDQIRFEYRVIEGVLQPKDARPLTNSVTEYVIRTGKPLLIPSEMDKVRALLGLVPTGKGARCYCGVPIFLGGRPAGVMAALTYDREFAYNERDMEVMQTAAGQVAVAIENARLFEREQRRAHYLEFLNNVSNAAISNHDAELMLAEITSEIRKAFDFDHIGIGVLDYMTNEIEIKAETGTSERSLYKRVPLGFGVIGRVARSNEMVLLQEFQSEVEGQLQALLSDAKSILCIPISYGDSMLGVLNVESRREKAFLQQEVLILRTLADLLATALHNAFVFQKMQQQSITDGLTGIKTRRFFLEALQSEWKRASRNGRPFSVVLIDLDNFKEVNDTLGHLEGDLVLARVARVLEQKCRQTNVVARYGGDEFVILMPETSQEPALLLAERLRGWIASDPMLSEKRITGSFGMATYPVHGTVAEEILRVADAGMYVSKRSGGNRVSAVDKFIEPEDTVVRKELLTAYVQGFVQREHTGPESIEELITTLRKLSRGSSAEPLKAAIDALARAVETREVHSAGHGAYSARYASMIGHELGLPEEELSELAYAARVHDVGKIIIPEKILCKPGPLTSEEFYLVKMHSGIGARILETLPECQSMVKIVRHHHERFDGTGYPAGLRGDQIPLGSRILGVADAFVNIITERPFAPARTVVQALDELQANSGTQLDGTLVRLFTTALQEERAAETAS